MSGVAEKKKDAFKRLRTVTILLAVLAIACGALAFFSERHVQEDLVAQKAAVEQKNAELRLIGAMPFLKHSRFFDSESRSLLSNVENNA